MEMGLEKFETLFYSRVYARSEDVSRTEFALKNSELFLNQLEEYANYHYELPKMYSAAIPDFIAGAMEHWVD